MKIRKTDLIFVAVLFLFGICLSIMIYLPRTVSGNYVEIRVDGNVLFTRPLSTDCTEDIQTEGGTNTFYIKAGTVYMKEADCHDKVCVNMRGISKAGETIVCLPHKLVLEIINRNEDAQPDAITGGGA